VLRGAPLFTTDAAVERSFPLREGWRFDLRCEFYNVLNHANFNPPGHVPGAPGFGVVSSARAGRTAQFSARVGF
jgi:hypothetical protein